MNIFENIQYLNSSQNPLMDNASSSTFDPNLAAVLLPALLQAQNQQQTLLNSSDQFTSNFGSNATSLPLSVNNTQNDNSSMNTSFQMQLEYLKQIQMMKQQQQQQDQQREQYKLALLSELLKLEQQSTQQPIQPLNGLGDMLAQLNQQQQQQQNPQNLLLELLLQQSKIGQFSEQPYLNEHQNQQGLVQTHQSTFNNISSSPKCVEGSYDSKTISFIPSIQSCSPLILAQVSPQLKKEDDSGIQLNQQNTQIFKNSGDSKRNSVSLPTTSLSHMMEIQDIMNSTNINQQCNDMNQNEIHSLTKILTQTNFDNSLFIPSQQSNAQQKQQQQQQILEGKNQNLDLNIFLKSQNNEEQIEIQRKRQERLIKIEKYKNKRRNWLRKISYDCRKKVADSRLRIKGRFISKKDTEKIKELIGDNEEAFNAKKNLRLDFMNNKMKLQNLDLNPAISKNEILCQIEKLLMKNRQIHTNQTMQAIVKRIQKKQQVFCLIKRGQTEMVRLNALKAANSGVSQHFSESNDESSSVCENSKNSGVQN